MVQAPGRANVAGAAFSLSSRENYQLGRTESAMNPGSELRRLREENQRLLAELWRQWEYNHAEHCGKPWSHDGKPWSHDGECYWSLPDVLGGSEGSQ